MKRLVIIILAVPMLGLANMSHLFNLERFDGSNPAVLTQIEQEGIRAVILGKVDNFSQTFYGTETSKTDTLQGEVALYEVRGDWSFHASINEALSGVQSDPRDPQITEVGIFIEDIKMGIAKLISSELSVGVAYKLERFGTYTKAGNTFLSARNELWLSRLNHQLYGGVTYGVSATEVVSGVVGFDIVHSNHMTLGWRPFLGAGISSTQFENFSMELSSKFFPRQYTVGNTLASNFMTQTWNNQLQVSTKIDDLRVYGLINFDIEDAQEGVVVVGALSDKTISRYELQIKKSLEGSHEALVFVALETQSQDKEVNSRVSIGAAFSLSFD